MKTQMRFQKVFMLISLIIGAFSIVYALIFCSGLFNQIGSLQAYINRVDGLENLTNVTQAFSGLFLTLGIILILTSVLLYVTGCHSRRKYYITNYVAVGIVVVYSLVYVALLIVQLATITGLVGAIDLEAVRALYVDRLKEPRGEWSSSLWMVYLGFALAAVVVINAVVLVLNTVWKVKLMQGEKNLLDRSVEIKEAA